MTEARAPASAATPAEAGGEGAAPALRIDVFTIFPEVVDAYCATSVVGRARRDGLVDLRVHDLRAGATGPHRTVDDAPFGGGAGMVLAPEPVFGAVELVDPPRPLYLLAPGGRRFDQSVAAELAGMGRATAGAGGRPSHSSAGATKVWTSGLPTTSSMESSPSAISCSLAASWLPLSWSRPRPV